MRQTAYEGIFNSIIPCIPAQNQHLIQLHGKKEYCLVGCIPLFSSFHGDQHTLDKTTHVLCACNTQIYFGIRKKFSLEKNLLRSIKEVLLSLHFCNDDQLCVLGSFSRSVLPLFFLFIKLMLLIGSYETRK